MKSTQLPYFTAAKHVDDPNELVTQELPQVYYIAARIRERLPKQIDMEDLVSAGVIGLLEASRKFDSSKNVEFPIFARFRIRGAILDSLRELDWGSRSIRKKGREVTECITDLRKSLGREPTESEIATTLNVSLQQLQKTLGEIDGLYLMGSQGGSTDDWEEGPDLIESAPSQDDSPYEQFERAERREHLEAAIAKLSEREQLVLSLYYREELTMREIAQVIGYAVSRVSQIHSAATAKLRASLSFMREPIAPNRMTQGMSERAVN